LLSSDSILELVDITLTDSSGQRLFYNLNFDLKSEETAVVIGPTGSGKTSLVELIIGAAEPDSGAVIIFGKHLHQKKIGQVARVRRKIGGVGGIYNLISYQTVYDNLIDPMIFRKESRTHKKKKIEKYLKELGLGSKKDTYAGNLSQGERVQVMLARAIIADQPLLLVDEPLAGLDGAVRARVIEILRRLSTSGHSMIIFTTLEDDFGVPDPSVYRLEGGMLK